MGSMVLVALMVTLYSSIVQVEASFLVYLLNSRVTFSTPEVLLLYQLGQISVRPLTVKVWIPAGLTGWSPEVHFPSAA